MGGDGLCVSLEIDHETPHVKQFSSGSLMLVSTLR